MFQKQKRKCFMEAKGPQYLHERYLFICLTIIETAIGKGSIYPKTSLVVLKVCIKTNGSNVGHSHDSRPFANQRPKIYINEPILYTIK